MQFFEIITFFMLCTMCWEFIHSKPTFGNEFVHIKVHVPKDVSKTRGVLKATYPGSPEYPLVSHKLVHHYHRGRKPYKRKPQTDTGPILENIFLAELDKGHVQSHVSSGVAAPIEETFVVKEETSVPNVNTFTVIEETIRKPAKPTYDAAPSAKHIETFKIIESNQGQYSGYAEEHKPKVETYKLIEHDYHTKSAEHNYHNVDQSHHYVKQSKQESRPLVETIKLVADDEHDYYSKPVEHYHHVLKQAIHLEHVTTRPQVDTIKVVEDDNENYYSKTSSGYKYREPQADIIEDDEEPQHFSKSPLNAETKIRGYDYQQPRDDPIRIMETPKYKILEEYEEPKQYKYLNQKNHPSQENAKDHRYNYERPQSETKKYSEYNYGKKSNDEEKEPTHDSSYQGSSHSGYYYHEPKEEVRYITKQKYHSSSNEYPRSRENTKKVNSYFTPKETEVVNDEPLEYGNTLERDEYSNAFRESHLDEVEFKRPSMKQVTSGQYGDQFQAHKKHAEYGNRETFEHNSKNPSYKPQIDHKETYHKEHVHSDDEGYEQRQYPRPISTPPEEYNYPTTQSSADQREHKYESKTKYHYEIPSHTSKTKQENLSQNYKAPAQVIHTSSPTNNAYSKPSSQRNTKTNFRPSSHYLNPASHENSSYQQQLPSTEMAPEFKSSDKSYHGSFTSNRQNTLFDELIPSQRPTQTSNIDWPEGIGKTYTTETYSGFDSYSAGHVQGLDSGGYQYHSPYA